MATSRTFARLTAFTLIAGCAITMPGTATASPLGATGEAPRTRDGVVKTLPIEPQVQEKNKWCWIATGLTVIRYLGNAQAKKLTQNQLCNIANNRPLDSDCPNEPGPIVPLQRAAGRFGVNGGTLVLNTVSFDTIKRNIDLNQPLWISLKWKQIDGGHLLTVSGYNEDEQEYQILDPWPKSVRVSWYDNEWSRNNDVYTWRETTYGIRKSGRTEAGLASKATTIEQSVAVPAQAAAHSSAQAPAATPDLDADGIAIWDALNTRTLGSTMQPDAATSTNVLALTPATLPQRVTAMMADVRTKLAGERADRSVTGLAAAPLQARAEGPAQLNPTLVSTYLLNPDFIHGRTSNPAEHSGYAQLALTGTGDTAVVHYGKTQGQVRYAGYSSGDAEVRYALQAEGGTVFMEPSTRAWFRLNGTTVTPLNDTAREITATPLSLEQYRASTLRRLG